MDQGEMGSSEEDFSGKRQVFLRVLLALVQVGLCCVCHGVLAACAGWLLHGVRHSVWQQLPLSPVPAGHSVGAAPEPLAVCSDMGATLCAITCECWLALPEGK